MNAIQDVVASIRDLLEPDASDDDVDVTGAEPKEWLPGRLYCYPDPGRLSERPFETSAAALQSFEIVAVYTEPSSESADRVRDPEITDVLDTKLAAYLAVIRSNATTALWGHIQAALRTPPRTLRTRNVAIGITGWRAVGA
jgi:hypothetical protein